MDYTAIFNKETEELISKGLGVAEGQSEVEHMRIIGEIDARMRLMEQAIEELRGRLHSADEMRKEHKKRLPSHWQNEVNKSEMDTRQKKQERELDRGAALKRAQANSMLKAMMAGGAYSLEEAKAILAKKGFV